MKLFHFLLSPCGKDVFSGKGMYDLVNGKVKEVWANPGHARLAFGHRYVYDCDNRIKEVYTSRKGL